MFIAPIQVINSLDEMQKTSGQISCTQNQAVGLPFQSFFTDALNNVKETNAVLEEEAYKLATGQTNNLHDITIASTKASLSLDLFISLRNKALDSYNELMRMNV